MSTRLLLVGDLHIRAGEHLDDVQAALRWVADLADEHQVHGVLLAGDAYEGRSTVVERSVLADFLTRVSADCHVVAIRGNHDQADDLLVFDGYPDVRTFQRPGWASVGPVDVLCIPWPERAFLAAQGLAGESGEAAGSAALGAILRGMLAAQPRAGHPVVVLAHLQVLGAMSSSAQPLIGRAIEATLGDLQDLGASFVALGHVHRPQELAPGIEYIGSLTCHDFGEEDEQKRVGILTVEDNGAASVEWLEVPCRRWVTVEGYVTSDGTVEEDCEAEDAARLAEGGFADCNLRYRYTCTEADSHLFNHEDIRRRFAAAHTLKIVPEIERTARVRAADVAAAKSAAEKLQAWGTATETAITPALLDKLHTLESEEGHA